MAGLNERRKMISHQLGRKSDWKWATDRFQGRFMDMHQEDFQKEICVCIHGNGMIKPCDLSVFGGKCRLYETEGKLDITQSVYRWLINDYNKQEEVKYIEQRAKRLFGDSWLKVTDWTEMFA